MSRFEIVTSFEPKGDQPRAIESLARSVRDGKKFQTLLGITGSGKTFTVAHLVATLQRPTLVIAPNKTLAAQLFQEFRALFPGNAVEYFVSYYDYYQPEAYVPSRDLYIEKEATRNDRLDKLRHSATRSLLERRDVIIVASVSCIYGLGSPEAYHGMHVRIDRGMTIERNEILRQLSAIQYLRNEVDFRRGTFRARGDVIDVFPAYEDARAVRVEMWGDEVSSILEIDALTGEVLAEPASADIWPMSHYVTPEEELKRAVPAIEEELAVRLQELSSRSKLLEAQRLEQRTRYDVELLRETGTCPGVENYSLHLTGRKTGEAPATLLSYFPEDLLVVIDESHVTVPQLGGMYRGDRSRKETLVEYGFRLPSALDNRPLTFEEFEAKVPQVVFVSATPGPYERKVSAGVTAEQVVRPTGLIDPPVEVRPVAGQVQDLEREIRTVAARKERTLVTTLTKRMAEDLTEYYLDQGLKVKYLHSEVDTIERAEIIAQLREGKVDVLIGINLLREGLDLPEVSLVAILDADKEGFLRSTTSLIQTCGRAARNLHGRVIMYADTITRSMRETIDETERRRALQVAFNQEHGITPATVEKGIAKTLAAISDADYVDGEAAQAQKTIGDLTPAEVPARIAALRQEMLEAAKALKFERAAELRDEIFRLEEALLALG